MKGERRFEPILIPLSRSYTLVLTPKPGLTWRGRFLRLRILLFRWGLFAQALNEPGTERGRALWALAEFAAEMGRW